MFGESEGDDGGIVRKGLEDLRIISRLQKGLFHRWLRNGLGTIPFKDV